MEEGVGVMDVRVLGQIEARSDAHPYAPYALGGPTQRRVFAALVARRGEIVDVSALTDVCWPDGDVPDRAEHNVHTYVHRLRGALHDDGTRIETVGTGYRLSTGRDEVDLDRLDDLARTAARCLSTGDAVAALDAIEEADRLWRGRPYGEFADEPWAMAEAAHFAEVRIALDEHRADALLAAGRPGEAVAGLERLIVEQQLRERPRALLMRALYESGRQAEALRTFQAFRRFLIDDAGVEPSPDLVELDRRIADGTLAGVLDVRQVGNYELHERIGEGAFAVVHRATQPSLGREVAVKIIRAELANRPEFIRRFEAEAQMVAATEHPNVVPLYDFWREPGRAFLVMRWMTGGSLETRLDDGPWSVDDTTVLVDQIAAALDAAHRHGVVHRDVKPGNILFDDAGRAYLGDFGIALAADERARPESALSEGSPIFAAPEQLRREPAGPEADVHALAIVAYTLLAGRTPFADAPDEPTLLQRQLNNPIPSACALLPDLPAAVDEVLAIATAKDPTDRYPTAPGFAAAFRAAATSGAARPDLPIARRPRSNPYKGLRAFDETDAADFHGRHRLVDELTAHLAQPDTRMLAVVGPSGSGKSSVVRAGLIPALRDGRVSGSSAWFTTTMIPGTRPFEALETALLRIAVNPPSALLDQLRDGERGVLRAVKRIVPADDGVVAIVVDQFEELFTGGVADGERDRFLRAMSVAVTEPVSPVRIILTLRADFYDRPLRNPEFAPLLKEHTVVVTPLAPDELEHAIITPAATVGVGFEPGLVAEIVADVNHEPGALPLLQYALTQAFDATDGDTITIDGYRSIGGLTGALGRRAEELYRAAGDGEQSATRRLFGRLVALGEGTEDTRRRVRVTELGHEAPTEGVLDRFGRARLLTFDHDPATREPTVEIAHEALIREWPRLRRWLDEDRDGLRIHRHLTETATAWIASGRDDGELYRGARLDAATTWAPDHRPDLNPTEREFLTASIAAHDAEQAAERERFEEQIRTNRRLRGLVGVVTAVAVLAAAIGLFAFQQRSRADEQADEARAQAAAAEQSRLEAEAAQAAADENAAQALDASADAAAQRERAEENASEAREQADSAVAAERLADLERIRAVAVATAPQDASAAALLAVEAHRLDPSVESLDVLHRVLTAIPGLRESIPLSGRRYFAAELAGDTTLLAAGSDGAAGTLDIWDLTDRELVESIATPPGESRPVLAVSDDGDMAVVARPPADDVVVVDLVAGEVSATFTSGAPLTDVDIDPTGSAIAVAREDGMIDIWSLPDLGEPFQIDTGVDVRLVRWSPSGAAVAAVTDTSTVQFWDVATRELRWSSETGASQNVLEALPSGALFSPDGEVVVVDSGLLYSIVRSYRTTDGEPAFPPTRRTDGEPGFGTLFWRDVERRHLTVGSLKSLATYDLTTGLEIGDRVERLTFFAAVHSETLQEIVAVGSQLVIRAADGAGPLERAIPLSDEQRAVADEGGTIHTTISHDGKRVLVSALGSLGIAPTTAFDLTSPTVTPTDFPYDDRLVFGNGALTFTFGGTPLGFTLLDEDDRTMGEFPLTFDTIDQDASADGRFVALAKSNGIVDLHAGSGELVHQFDLGLPTGTSGEIVIPSLSDDGRFLSASNSSSHVAVWSTETFERIDGGRFDGQTRIAGDLLANRDDGVVRLYSLPDLEPVGRPMINEQFGQFYPALDPVHGRLAVTSQDAVSVYDIETGRQIGSRLPYRPIRIEYTADGTQLVVADDDRVTVWNYDTDTWDDIACEVAGRNLTIEEWEQLGPRTIEYRPTCEQYPVESGPNSS